MNRFTEPIQAQKDWLVNILDWLKDFGKTCVIMPQIFGVLLRQQLIVLERQAKRPMLSWRERGIIVLLASKLRSWKETLVIVQLDTALRWHRDLFRLVWRLQHHLQMTAQAFQFMPRVALIFEPLVSERF